MALTRRKFLAGSGALMGGLALSSLGIDLGPVLAYAEEMKKIDKVKSAKQTTSICCYCAVGCGLIASTDAKTGKIINIEGDPEHPINEGSLCAKGAGTYQTTAANEHRLTKVLYRAPKSDKWQEKSWDWAITEIAKRIKKDRDAGFIAKNSKGEVVNRVENIAHMGSSNVDNEECWLITAMARSLGLVYIDHQARV
jgi:formate dehydrogenase major subunit